MVDEAVTPEHIAAVVARWTGIPVERMLEGERAKLLAMENLRRRVVGQDEAVNAVANAIRRARAGCRTNRPIGSFLFLQAHGVGKTELTRALAEFLFDSEQAMIRIDMSEYMEALGRAPDRRPARLRRLRGGRQPDRGGAPAAVSG